MLLFTFLCFGVLDEPVFSSLRLSVPVASGVPSNAVLLFELELLQLQKGVPEGFFFIWLQDSPEPLFPSMDMNRDQEVPLEEVCSLLSALLLAIQYTHSDGVKNMKAWIILPCLNGSDWCWWCNGVGDIFLAHFGLLSSDRPILILYNRYRLFVRLCTW